MININIIRRQMHRLVQKKKGRGNSFEKNSANLVSLEGCLIYTCQEHGPLQGGVVTLGEDGQGGDDVGDDFSDDDLDHGEAVEAEYVSALELSASQGVVGAVSVQP